MSKLLNYTVDVNEESSLHIAAAGVYVRYHPPLVLWAMAQTLPFGTRVAVLKLVSVRQCTALY